MASYGEQMLEWIKIHSASELGYVFLIVLLFIVPRMLLRFGIPMAITAFGIGLFTKYSVGFYDTDNVIPIFSTLGVISLFLFAGLEVDIDSMRKTVRPILGHIGIRALVVATLSYVFAKVFTLPLAPAVVLTLALATPSTGFILDSIETMKISEVNKFWIKLKAISAELIALGALVVFSQMDSAVNLLGSIMVILILVLVLPFLFRKLAQTLEKLAPGSEFSFILMLAIISGLITKKLGAYYLVGAFLVGMVAGRYKRTSPSASADNMLQSLRSFSAFFMPFYFFNSGLKMPKDAFTYEALMIAIIFFLISAPIKVGSIVLHRQLSMVETWRDSLSVSLSLMPNLVFGLVLAEILKNKMGLNVTVYGGLIIYTLFVTVFSPLVLRFMPNSEGLEIVFRDTESLNPLDKSNLKKLPPIQ